jgi:hypothetical protein
MLNQVISMITALQMTIYNNNTLIADTTAESTLSPASTLSVLQHGRVDAAVLPPFFIEGISSLPTGLATLRNLKVIYTGGAPLTSKAAAPLLQYTKLVSVFGSTEQGIFFRKAMDDNENWEYFSFHECMGIDFRFVTDGMYELVIVRKEELAPYQQVFRVYPDLQEFATKDLFIPHPTKPDCWRYAGRMDDMIVFSHCAPPRCGRGFGRRTG